MIMSIVNKNLIDYLNYSDSYLEIDSGIYKIFAKKVSNDDINYIPIKNYIDSIKSYKFNTVFEFNEHLATFCYEFVKYGLEFCIMVDIKACDVIDDFVNAGVDENNIHLITPRLLKYNKFKFDDVYIRIADIKLIDINEDMCCNALDTLFYNDEYIHKISIDINKVYNGSIVIDDNNVVLDGRFKVMLMKFLYDPDIKINCKRLFGVHSIGSEHKKYMDVNTLLSSFRTPSSRLVKFIRSKYCTQFSDNSDELTLTVIELCKEHIKNWLETL